MGPPVEGVPGPSLPFGEREDLLVPLMGGNAAFYSRHLLILSFALEGARSLVMIT
jgi:hypothetical protein